MEKKAKEKKKYTPPKVKTEKIFEGNALACGKVRPQTSGCLQNIKTS